MLVNHGNCKAMGEATTGTKPCCDADTVQLDPKDSDNTAIGTGNREENAMVCTTGPGYCPPGKAPQIPGYTTV